MIWHVDALDTVIYYHAPKPNLPRHLGQSATPNLNQTCNSDTQLGSHRLESSQHEPLLHDEPQRIVDYRRVGGHRHVVEQRVADGARGTLCDQMQPKGTGRTVSVGDDNL